MEQSEVEQPTPDNVAEPVKESSVQEPVSPASEVPDTNVAPEENQVEVPPPVPPVSQKKKSFFPVLLIFLALLVLLGGAVWFLLQSNILSIPGLPFNTQGTEVVPEEVAPAPEMPITIPVVEEEPVVQEVPTKNDAILIKEVLAEKYSKDPEDVSLGVREMTTEYAAGSVKFAGEISGGWWLAAKVSGDWVIVADGNGTVMCSDIAPYSFPASMVPECYDETTGSLNQL